MLEICTDSIAGVAAAVAGGADRIELCGALEVGGLTPSAGLVAEAVRACAGRVALFAMVRPRAGDFAYDDDEFGTATAEAEALLTAGVDGLVFGAVRDGRLDEDACRRFVSAVGSMRRTPLTFHRAVDLLDDPVAAVAPIAALGFQRILTSGGAITAPAGAATIRAMVERAGEAIAIMAGSGVAPEGVEDLIAATGVREVHASASRSRGALDTRVAALGFASGSRRETSIDLVRALRAAHDRALTKE